MTKKKKYSLNNQQQPNNLGKQIITQAQRVEMLHSGPLPPAREVEKFAAIYSKAPEMIFAYAEKEQEFRHKHVNEQRTVERKLSIWGLTLGFIIVIVMLGTIIYSIHEKMEGPAITLGVALSVIAGIFVLRKLKKK